MILSYKICKELKRAGYRQELKDGDKFYIYTDQHTIYVVHDYNFRDKKSIKIPTLTELISASWDGIWNLEKGVDGWRTNVDDGYKFSSEGKTPEEAVANLWITLQDVKKINI